jgi:hypothetical protein
MRLACHRHRNVITLVNKTLGSQAMAARKKERTVTSAAMVDLMSQAGIVRPQCDAACVVGWCGINA